MKYKGVAHHLCANPELDSLRKHGKSFHRLSPEHAKEVEENVGDLRIHAVFRDTPEEAMQDALALCQAHDLHENYAMIKRQDGHYFTSVDLALRAEKA